VQHDVPKAAAPKAAVPKPAIGWQLAGVPLLQVVGGNCLCCSVRPRRGQSRFCCGICERLASGEEDSSRAGFQNRHGKGCTWSELSYLEFNGQPIAQRHSQSNPNFWA
jgi:hypothetical protein